MLGIFATSVFLSSSFAPHYLTSAAPGLALGVFVFAEIVDRLCSAVGPCGVLAARSVQALAFAYHSTFVLAPLASEWNYNQKPAYHALVETLRKTPDPLLTIGPIYAVEAYKELVRDPYQAYVRGIKQLCRREACEAMAAKACTILLEPLGNKVFAPPIQADWRNRFQTLYGNQFGTILLTNHPHCAQLGAEK